MALPHRSSAAPLSLGLALLIAYASLYPFGPWVWPAGATLAEVMVLRWPNFHVAFDMWANFLGYIPMGLLAAVAALRAGARSRRAVAGAALAAAALSYLMEVLQQCLAGRHPSLMDWALNSSGGGVGALVAALAERQGWLGRWSTWRERWLLRDAGTGLALLVAWPLGLLFPAPFPFGLGLGWERVQDWMVGWLLDVPWAQEALELVSDIPVPMERPAAVVAGAGVLIGLLVPCLVVCAITRPGLRRLVLCAGVVVGGLGATTLSAAMNFGPGHAMGWRGPETGPAVVVAAVFCLGLSGIGSRLAAVLGLALTMALLILVAQVPADPYFAVSLQSWEQGRFIHFHGLSQWVGWLWPYLLLAWLCARLSSREGTAR